jgi:hypothetical protein
MERANPKRRAELDTTDERDDYMISCCREESLTLVSRDKKAVKKAKAAGVRSLLPEEYAQTVLSREKAHSLFLERLTSRIYRIQRLAFDRAMHSYSRLAK